VAPPGGRVRAPPLPPWQFLVRAAMVISGLVLLLVVDVHGVVFYVAWVLIVLALAGEAVGTLVYWVRSRRG
jgi:hypothetical protein